ncbi:MAG: cytochrome c biogenesis protein CcdA, partial [Myxococcota bacterium]
MMRRLPNALSSSGSDLRAVSSALAAGSAFLSLVAFSIPARAGSGLESELADSLSNSLAGGHWAWAVLACFVGGFLTALTPCVYPLIPITVRYFGAMGPSVSRGKVLRNALVYVAGMGLLYTVLGTVFASLNLVFGSFLASPWVVAAVAVFCFAMGLSMLGAFTIQLPTSLNTRLARVGGQGAIGAFGMGLVSGLVAAPCTGPVLAVILAVIASSGQVAAGAAYMLFFSAGLGLPFLVLALASGQLQRVPRSGPWMELVKGVLATAMFVVALYFANLAFPVLGRGLGWSTGLSVGLVVAGLALGGLALRSAGRSAALSKTLATVTLTLGIASWAIGAEEPEAAGAENRISWVREHDEGFELARSAGKPVMIDFTADWCVACKELDSKVFS